MIKGPHKALFLFIFVHIFLLFLNDHPVTNSMEYNNLGKTTLNVSKICLGTMTFGQQNTESDGHSQLDYALDKGVNFIDTAEMYPVPARKETQGSTESIIGSWLKKRGGREKIILASKVTGPSKGMSYIRSGPDFTRSQILKAIEGSLSRLQTEYLDLYQLHWPERNTNYFGKLMYNHQPDEKWEENFSEVIAIMNDLKKEGKIRYFGLSNETPWGLMKYLSKSNAELDGPVSIQNPYSLLNRSFEVGLSEICLRENIGMLAYSPLAFGVLSGKYLNGHKPPQARLTLFPNFLRYSNEQATDATAQYLKIAEKHNLPLSQLALSFVTSSVFVTSNIIGATKLDQLKENIASINIKLNDEILSELEEVHKKYTFPAP